MLEIEIKTNMLPEQIEDKLLELGAKMLRKEKQIDTYFKHPCYDFKTRDEAFRVREVRGKFYLTYKGPKIDRETKTREEIEIEVESKIFTLLERLGFTPLKKVIKRRKVYQWQKLKIFIDQVEDLGEFLEVEADKKEELFQLIDQLGIPRSSLIRKSYLELLMEKERQIKTD